MNGFWRFDLRESPAGGAGSISAVAGAARGGLQWPKWPRANGPYANIGGSVLRSYGAALSFVAVALFSTLLLQHLFPYPFLFLFFAAVMASAWFGGMSAGLFAVLVSTVLVEYFFVPPFNSFAVNTTDTTYFVAFVVCALAASMVSSSKRKNEAALLEARDHLEIRVAERTAELEKSNAELRRSIQEYRRAQQSLMRVQAELAHLSRVLTMGELTTSIAHEISQPLTAVVTHGHACREWLSCDPPNLEKARQTAERIIQDGTRAGAVLGRIRALFKKEAPARDWLDMNELIEELTILLRDEATRRRVELRTELVPGLPRVKGDRVQLQQVVLNLIMNGMDAMAEITCRPRDLVVSSRRNDSNEIVVRVEDCGIGFAPEVADKVFDPFFTTKPQGIGMGLSISRSIIESHEGRVWAAGRPSGGATFQFVIPLPGRKFDG